MASQHIIPITNGKGSKELADGSYTVEATASGYDASTITPSTQEITEGVDSYSFTLAATGVLTLHVTDDGTDIGIPIVGASFHRCDQEGTTYGEAIVSGEDGNAIFNAVPYDADTPPIVYFKQINSDGEHTFDGTLQNVEMDAETKVVEIANGDAPTREFTLTDANYEGLPIADGEITLSS